MALRLRCPSCRQAFAWDGKLFPDECELCHAVIGGNRADDDIVMPFIRASSNIAKTVDKLYRDTERGSEVRAGLAAEAVGAPVSEMSALKMTNMQDNQRYGDIAEKLVPAQSEGQFFQPNGASYMAGNASGAVAVNGQVTHGIAPRAGATAVEGLRSVMGQGPWQVATKQ